MDTSELPAKVNPLGHFNAIWHNNQLDLEITQLPKIFYYTVEAFTAPMYKLVNKYADAFRKLANLLHEISSIKSSY